MKKNIKYFGNNEELYEVCLAIAKDLKDDTYLKIIEKPVTSFQYYLCMNNLMDKMIDFLNKDIIDFVNMHMGEKLNFKYTYDNNTFQLFIEDSDDYFSNNEVLKKTSDLKNIVALLDMDTSKKDILNNIYKYINIITVYPKDKKEIIYYQGVPYKLGIKIIKFSIKIGLCDVNDTDENYSFIKDISHTSNLGFAIKDKSVVINNNDYYAISTIISMAGIGVNEEITDTNGEKYQYLSFENEDLKRILGYEKYINILNMDKHIF